MMDHNVTHREELLILLLQTYKDLQIELSDVADRLEHSTDGFYQNSIPDHMDSVNVDLLKLSSNVKEIQIQNASATEAINAWYLFTKEKSELKKFTFPIHFFLMKRSVKKKIKNINQTISEIAMENRFIREKISNWQNEMEAGALCQLKDGASYRYFVAQLKKKDELKGDILYLLKTMNHIYTKEIDFSQLDPLIEKLKTYRCQAASL